MESVSGAVAHNFQQQTESDTHTMSVSRRRGTPKACRIPSPPNCHRNTTFFQHAQLYMLLPRFPPPLPPTSSVDKHNVNE
jgi:hypothetical protein